MTRAVVLSLLLHLFFLLLMISFLHELPVPESFPVIRVQLLPAAVLGGGVDASTPSEPEVRNEPAPVSRAQDEPVQSAAVPVERKPISPPVQRTPSGSEPAAVPEPTPLPAV
ncbi:MAG: hypothetical protein PQJ50_05390, partial [Spirochaetales bacterium]|nr:hypothetical protein [Spirochaetales bacterium]